MNATKQFVSDVVGLIGDAFGESTAKMYAQYYEDKPIGLVKVSATELLREALGPERAEEELSRIHANV